MKIDFRCAQRHCEERSDVAISLLSAFVATVDDSSSSVGGGVADLSLQCALQRSRIASQS